MNSVSAVIAASAIRKFAEYRAYSFDFFVGLAIKFVFFMAAMYATPLREPVEATARVYGFVIWYLTSHLLAKTANIVVEEAYIGTLGQVLTARTSFPVFVISVAVMEILFSIPWVLGFLGIAALSTPIRSVLPSLLHAAPTAVGLACLNFIGVGGMAIVLLGLSFRFKRVGSLTEIISFYLLFFSGFFFPPDQLPAVVRQSNMLSPLFWAVSGLTEGWAIVPRLLGSSMLWILSGVLVFRYYWEWARRTGRLTAYV